MWKIDQWQQSKTSAISQTNDRSVNLFLHLFWKYLCVFKMDTFFVVDFFHHPNVHFILLNQLGPFIKCLCNSWEPEKENNISVSTTYLSFVFWSSYAGV